MFDIIMNLFGLSYCVVNTWLTLYWTEDSSLLSEQWAELQKLHKGVDSNSGNNSLRTKKSLSFMMHS